MSKLIYSAIASLDGYTADTTGNFDWAAPDEDVHQFVNDLERSVGTYLYGRKMYEVMSGWETMDVGPTQTEVMRDYATIWKAADKIVYSTTLKAAVTERTQIQSTFESEVVRRFKSESASDISIGGPHLAAQALCADLIDELQLITIPIIIGGGNHWLPHGRRYDLEVLDHARFDKGVTFHRYRTIPGLR